MNHVKRYVSTMALGLVCELVEDLCMEIYNVINISLFLLLFNEILHKTYNFAVSFFLSSQYYLNRISMEEDSSVNENGFDWTFS